MKSIVACDDVRVYNQFNALIWGLQLVPRSDQTGCHMTTYTWPTDIRLHIYERRISSLVQL